MTCETTVTVDSVVLMPGTMRETIILSTQPVSIRGTMCETTETVDSAASILRNDVRDNHHCSVIVASK